MILHRLEMRPLHHLKSCVKILNNCEIGLINSKKG